MKNNSKNLMVIVGLGKTGLSCVRFLVKRKKNIAVVDSSDNPPGLAELKKKYPAVPVFTGKSIKNILEQATQLIISPGISLKTPLIAKQIAKGTPAIGDIELFTQATTKPIIAITGSNGKSTVTTLLGEMAKATGLKVGVGGNLGKPALDLLANPEPDLYVLELSSFQLETTYSLKTVAATVLNVTPDHLDRHQNIKEYAAIKMRIFNGSKNAIINRDNCWFLPSSFRGKFDCISFGYNEPIEYNFGLINDYLSLDDEKLISVDELLIKGRHQVANALAALALGYAAKLPMYAMLRALRTFPGLEHRCQLVAKIDNVDWFNDSKGTNIGATEAAIAGIGDSIRGKIVLIAGGQGKGADFSKLFAVTQKFVRTLILIGVDAPKIGEALRDACPIVYAESMAQAVTIAKEQAQPGDSVLLSPACASFDMFKNFEHRGQVFTDLVKKLLTK
jgi:UDP-N-acetylmuramoylalanine--D-glutamate ligase